VDVWSDDGKSLRKGAVQIYVVQSGGLLKIGQSVDVARRLRAISTMSSVPLVLVALSDWHMPGLERDLHACLASHRQHGEWFADVPEVRLALHRAGLQFVDDDACPWCGELDGDWPSGCEFCGGDADGPDPKA
jgi:hypothetical protein